MLPDSPLLPPPDSDALAHSARLADCLRARIAGAGGWLDFAAFMEGLLFEPGLGYYAAGAARFRAAGDFTTAPEISPLFGKTLARAVAPLLRALPDGDLIEPGAGTGRLALSLLPALAAAGAVPGRYAILEPSPALRQEQAAMLAALPDALRARVVWLDDLPEQIRGVVVANEVLDAMPVHLLRWRSGTLFERGVVPASGEPAGFAWEERPAGPALETAAARRAVTPADGVQFELARMAEAWSATVASRLEAGAVLLIDYGDAARALHGVHRPQGTLRCFYRHHVHGNPLILPGLQDVTASVDFTAIAGSLAQGGLTLHDYDTQAAFLLAQGILAALDPAVLPGTAAWVRQTTGLQHLISPAEMGESFKVLIALRDPDGTLAGLLPGPGPLAVGIRLGCAELSPR